MQFGTIILTILGLALFEVVSSIDNAIINASVLETMGKRARRWFMLWGIIFAVFIVRGLLPWIIIWATNPSAGIWGSFLASFSNNPNILASIEASSPILFAGGGVFLVLLFLYWLFMEEKSFGLPGEKFFYSQGVWFYAVASVFLALIVWFAEKINPMMAFGAVVGSTAFFITHGFKQNAEEGEKNLMKGGKSDMAKVLYLEIIDATFSIDGVLGAFAFTLSVPLILIGNGIGAIILRRLTLGNIANVKKYIYLKNGAMYSICTLGMIMILDAFGASIPDFVSPVITFCIVGYFFFRSKLAVKSR